MLIIVNCVFLALVEPLKAESEGRNKVRGRALRHYSDCASPRVRGS